MNTHIDRTSNFDTRGNVDGYVGDYVGSYVGSYDPIVSQINEHNKKIDVLYSVMDPICLIRTDCDDCDDSEDSADFDDYMRCIFSLIMTQNFEDVEIMEMVNTTKNLVVTDEIVINEAEEEDYDDDYTNYTNDDEYDTYDDTYDIDDYNDF